MDPVSVGVLSILPPVIAVVLALITKEVFSSLIVGILSGTLIYTLKTDGNIILGPVESALSVMGNKFDLNIVLFCSLLGALVYVIYMAGASKAYGNWATAKIKGRRSALLSTSALGAFIFIDDYFNCLTVGTVMRPITDKYKISREKLAYIIDSTAAPICIIAPVSSWAAAVGSNLKATNTFDSDIAAFCATIPWNFYALLCILLVVLVCCFNVDFGPMYKAEKEAYESTKAAKTDVKDTDESIEVKGNGTVLDMVVPIISLIIFAVLAMLYLGGYWGEDEKYHTLGAAFGNTDSSQALVLSSFGALVVAFIMMVPRKLLSLKEYMDGVLRGVQAMIPANMILTFAWTISGVTRDLLQAPEFIVSAVNVFPSDVEAGIRSISGITGEYLIRIFEKDFTCKYSVEVEKKFDNKNSDEEVAEIVSKSLKARIGVKPYTVVVHKDGGLNTRSEHKSKRIIDERTKKD
jgi:tetracycline resistance efflux pump